MLMRLSNDKDYRDINQNYLVHSKIVFFITTLPVNFH